MELLEFDEIIKICLTSIGSIAVLFILTKIMGNRELSQLSMFDYINGITIGSITAEMATALEDNFLEPLTAMIIYALVIVILSFITDKSMKARRVISGIPIVLYNNGQLYRTNFKKNRIDLNEFLMQCRINGYFNLSDIQTAILEPNGKISFLPTSLKRPSTPEDLNLQPNNTKVSYNIIIDGKILYNNLKNIGRDINWLNKQIKESKTNIKDIFLANFDENDYLNIYPNNNKQYKKSVFE